VDSAFALDYLLGGFIAGGVPPQLGSTDAPTPWDAQAAAWVARFNAYGHAVEGAAETLVFDATCCHVPGLCEWVACADAIAVALTGGHLATPATAGVIVATNATVALPAALTPDGATVLLFQAATVPVARVDAGDDGAVALTLVLTSPVAPCVDLGGGFWRLATQDVRVTRIAPNGTVLGVAWAFGRRVSGRRRGRACGTCEGLRSTPRLANRALVYYASGCILSTQTVR